MLFQSKKKKSSQEKAKILSRILPISGDYAGNFHSVKNGLKQETQVSHLGASRNKYSFVRLATKNNNKFLSFFKRKSRKRHFLLVYIGTKIRVNKT